jgi:hypothetical protein
MYDLTIDFLELGGVASCSTGTMIVRGASFGKLAVGADFFLEELELLSLIVILA